MADVIKVPVSFGEVLDKITILEIKSERIKDETKVKNVRLELDELSATWDEAVKDKAAEIADLRKQLKAVNEELWVIEDDIRDQEAAQDFGARFIELARAVYVTNDKRAAIKKEVNLALGSRFVEEKSYQDYTARKRNFGSDERFHLTPLSALATGFTSTQRSSIFVASATVIRSIAPSNSAFAPHRACSTVLPVNFSSASGYRFTHQSREL